MVFQDEVAYETKYKGYFVIRSGKVISTKIKGGQGSLNYNNLREHCYKIDKDGYLEVLLSYIENHSSKRAYKRVHRLVWETINGEIKNNLTIDHKDGNKANNSICNLQLLTREENTSKSQKGKPSPKRYLYKLYKNSTLLGVYDRKQLKEKIGLKSKDFYRETTNKKQLLLQSYKWILTNVEDIEKVS